MKRSVRIMLGLLTLLLVSVAGYTATHIEPEVALGFVKENALELAVVAPIVSSKITPELINDLKIKFGTLKIITVVVESPVYDIDNMTREDRRALVNLGVEVPTLLNTDLPIKERMSAMEKLKEYKDETRSHDAAALYGKYKGKEVEPGEQYEFLARRPDRKMVKVLTSYAEKKDFEKFNDLAVNNLIVGGEVDALEDGVVFMGVVNQLKPLLQPVKSFLSKA